MFSRRALLLGAAAAAGGAQAGCTTNPIVLWLPAGTPEPLEIAGAAGAAEHAAQLAFRAAVIQRRADDWELTQRQSAALAWFAEACTAHARTLASGDPGRRQSGPVPSVSPVPAPADARAGYAKLTELLRADADRHRRRAAAATGPAALLWAGLGAFAATMGDRLPSGGFTGADDGTATTPELTEGEEDWGRRLLLRSYEARYALQAVLAAPGLGDGPRGHARRGLMAWAAARDTLIDRRRATGADIPAADPAYRVTIPATARRAAALGARVQGAALPEIGAWLANAESAEVPLAADLLIATCRSAVGFGAPAPRWPGWSG